VRSIPQNIFSFEFFQLPTLVLLMSAAVVVCRDLLMEIDRALFVENRKKLAYSEQVIFLIDDNDEMQLPWDANKSRKTAVIESLKTLPFPCHIC
jgi:hypothetical protein